jgi:predicted esterase
MPTSNLFSGFHSFPKELDVSHPTEILWTKVPDFRRLAEIGGRVDRLFAGGALEEALRLIESTWPGLPESGLDEGWVEILLLKAFLLTRLRRKAEALAVFDAMSRCGASSSLGSPAYESLRDLPGYEALVQANEEILARERRAAQVVIDVHLPPADSGRGPAPLMLVLHGEPGSLSRIRADWPTESILERGVIVAYLQSSQLRSTGRYVWTADTATARADIVEAVRQIRLEHAVDPNRILRAGFSAGATTAFDVLLRGDVPAAGFIFLCAGERPASFAEEALEAARRRGVRGVLFEGEQNWPDEEENEMLQPMRQAGLPIEFVLNPGVGHGVPHDFPERVSRALDFVLP